MDYGAEGRAFQDKDDDKRMFPAEYKKAQQKGLVQEEAGVMMEGTYRYGER